MKRWFELHVGRQRHFRHKKFNLLIVGAQKAGTTSLHYALNQHPDIFMTNPIKEPGYFLPFPVMQDYFRKKGIQLKSKKHFFEYHLLKGYKGERYMGESSTFYTTKEWSEKKLVFNIFKYNSQIKIYHEYKKNKQLTFSDFLENEEAFEISCYNKRILPFFQVLDNQQILLIDFEKMINEPQKLMKNIYKFLNIDDSITVINFPFLNKSSKKKYNYNIFKEQILQHRSSYPALLYGSHNLLKIKNLERDHSINQLFAPSLSYLPFMHALKKPIVYNVSTGIGKKGMLLPNTFLKKVNAFVVSNEKDKKILLQKGHNNVKLIRSAIDTSKFKQHQLPLSGKLHLLMASAPWENKQFYTKGIHLLLSALQQVENVHLTFLWRNVLVKDMQQLITQYQVQDKITFINETVDIQKLLKQVHGCVLLCSNASIVKSYPHSLLEALISGKPVITSKEIPIADYVTKNKCGLVLDAFDADQLVQLFHIFHSNIKILSEKAMQINVHDFSIEKMMSEYRVLYNNILSSRTRVKGIDLNTFPTELSRGRNIGNSIPNISPAGGSFGRLDASPSSDTR